MATVGAYSAYATDIIGEDPSIESITIFGAKLIKSCPKSVLQSNLQFQL